LANDPLADAVLTAPAIRGRPVVLIEDAVERRCSAADKIEMLAKRAAPALTMADLARPHGAPAAGQHCYPRGSRRLGAGSAEGIPPTWTGATLPANSAADGLGQLKGLIGGVTQRIPLGPSIR